MQRTVADACYVTQRAATKDCRAFHCTRDFVVKQGECRGIEPGLLKLMNYRWKASLIISATNMSLFTMEGSKWLLRVKNIGGPPSISIIIGNQAADMQVYAASRRGVKRDGTSMTGRLE